MKVIPVMRSLPAIRSSIPWFALIVSAVGITAIGMRIFETDEARAKRAEGKRQKDLRSLADEMSGYGQGVHQRYPTGNLVVSVADLAEQLGKRADAVAKALHLLLTEQKVQKAPLKGYWKLNVWKSLVAFPKRKRPGLIESRDARRTASSPILFDCSTPN